MPWPIDLPWPKPVLLAAFLAAGLPAQAQEPLPQDAALLGAQIFAGAPAELADPGALRMVTRLPCKSCHGADGSGGQEGRAPPIDGPTLTRPTADRPAYDADTFASALNTGTGAGGQALSRLMPRYALTGPEARALFDHLSALPRLQRLGVTPDQIMIGVPAFADGNDARYLDDLRRAMEERLGGTFVHGRQVDFLTLSPQTPPETAPVLAALALPKDWLPAFAAHDLPVLFPFGQLEGPEDPGLVRGFLPSAQDVRRSLAERLMAEADGPVAVLPPGPEAEALLRSLTLAGVATVGTEDQAAAKDLVVLTAGALKGALRAAPDARLWLDRKVIAAAGALPPQRRIMAYTDLGALVGHQDASPFQIHARIAGTILAEVLLEAGRDLTRAGLMQAFGRAYLAEFGLDYRAAPLTGGGALRFDVLGPPP